MKNSKKVGKSPSVTFMAVVAKDILNIKMSDDDGLKKSYRKFYKVMRKHGIKQGTKVGGGTRMSNPEWVICEALFKERMKDNIHYFNILGMNVPKDLTRY